MKRLLFMTVMALSLSACDNTKLQLRAPGPDNNGVAPVPTVESTDSLATDSINLDSIVLD